MTRIPIVVKVWAGGQAHDFEYISRSLPSLLRSHLPAGAEIVVFDDCSTDPRLRPFLQGLAERDPRVRIMTADVNKGPNRGQADAYAFIEAEYGDAPYFVNVDDDVVYHRKWLVRLLDAREDLRGQGINGIFTALNIPFRAPHQVVRTESATYLLKWKQPALNWLIPREIYDEVGPFSDEGVAYDTVYTHWLRLNGYPVICMTPSFVQNIGTFGAYSRDQSTTCDDFLGEGSGDGLFAARCRGLWRRAMRPLRTRIPDVAPIRWGAEWVYEQRVDPERGKSVAVCRADDAVALGWSHEELATRAARVQEVQAHGPFSIVRLRRGTRGRLTGVEYGCPSWANLYEARKYAHRYGVPHASALFSAIVRDLVPFHQQGVGHNKIRPENVYISLGAADVCLAWYGHEPPPGKPLVSDKAATLAVFGQAVDRRTSIDVRERFVTSYLAAMAPEVLMGEPATLRSDVFSVAAVVLLAVGARPMTFAALEEQRASWHTVSSAVPDEPRGLRDLLMSCVAPSPSRRPASAVELRTTLSQLGAR